jgi:hypothetical protein
MRSTHRLALAALTSVAASLLIAPSAFARQYEVTITNLTTGQPLTPPVVATHHGKHAIFDVGQPASVGVREVAENGNSTPLLASLASGPMIGDFAESTTGPLVPAGLPGDAMFDQSATLNVNGEPRHNRLSFISMLICTNDGFTGTDGLKLPGKVGRATTATSAGYDGFTELNTEDYADIVPPCQGLVGDTSGEPGTGVSNPALAESGVISHHAGIQGGSDLKPELHGWTDPVAQIRVERTG